VRYARGTGMAEGALAGQLHVHPDAVAYAVSQGPLTEGMLGFENARSWHESIHGNIDPVTGVRQRDTVLNQMEAFNALTDAQREAQADLATAYRAISDAAQRGAAPSEMRELNARAREARATADRWDQFVARREPEIRANYQEY